MEQQNKEKIIPKKTEVSAVETYAEDMAQVIGDNREGLIKKIIHQDEVDELEKNNMSPESRKNKFFGVMGAILILGTLGILAYATLQKNTDSVFIEKPFTPLIFTDKSVSIEISGLSKDKIVEAVHNAFAEASLKANEVEGIYLTENKKTIGLRRFVELTKGALVVPALNTMPDVTVSDNFLLGVVNNEIKTTPEATPELSKDFFILIKIRSMSEVFSDIRTWENKMFSDLYGFFGINLSSETEYLLTKDFEDGIIENKNARILYEGGRGNKNIAMMYVFANNTSIVISKSPSTVQEIILRLASSQKAN